MRADEILIAFQEAVRAIHQFAVGLLFYEFHHSLNRRCACGSLTFCATRSENSQPMKKYILSLLGIFVAMAFIASCREEGTTVTEEPVRGPTTYMNRPSPLPTR